MNDENLQMYLYGQLNDILDSAEDNQSKQMRLGRLFLTSSNSISSIYLVNHQDKADEMIRMMGGTAPNFKSLLENQWYIYTNIAIWIDFMHALYSEITPSHPQYEFFGQIMDTLGVIENELGIQSNSLVS